MMKPFYKLKKARRQALRRWSGVRNATGYDYRGWFWWIPKRFWDTRYYPKGRLEYLLDSIIDFERRQS